MFLFFHCFHSNVPENKCHKQKLRVLIFTRIKLVARLLVCARAIARIKWRRLQLDIKNNKKLHKKLVKRIKIFHKKKNNKYRNAVVKNTETFLKVKIKS